MNVVFRILAGAAAGAGAGFVTALVALLFTQLADYLPFFHGESGFGFWLVVVGIMILAPLFGAAGGLLRRVFVVGLGGLLAGGMIGVGQWLHWFSLTGAQGDLVLAIEASSCWAAAGVAGAIVGRLLDDRRLALPRTSAR